jgi:hypothetical protein
VWTLLLSLPIRLVVIGIATWWFFRQRRLGRITLVRQQVLLVLCVLASGWVLYPLGRWLDGETWAVNLAISGMAIANELWAMPLVGFASYYFTKRVEERHGIAPKAEDPPDGDRQA